ATGASEMYITNTSGCSSDGSWEAYATSKAGWTLGQTNATATVYTKYKDEAGNESACINDTITHDDTAPTSPMVTIAGGSSTSDGTPDLILSAVSADYMYITNTSGCGSGGTWEAYATSKANWTLGQTNAVATVYAKYKDEAGNESTCANDTITHDDTAPGSPSLVISGGTHTLDATPDLTLSAADASEMYITNTSGCGSGGTWEAYATSKSNWTLAQTNAVATVYVKYKDALSNTTSCVNDTITHDNVGPTSPAMLISSGATYTTSSSVTLSPAATSASDMYITNTSGCGSGGSWETYATTKAGWSLGQTNSTATVYAKYKDEAGNESTCENDTIVHDNIAPSDPSSFVDGVESKDLTESADMTWVTSTDAGSGFSSYELSLGTSSGATDVQDWTDIGDVLTTSMTGLSLTEGTTYYANIRGLDNAGNISSVVSGDGFAGFDPIDCSGLSGGTWVGVPGDSDYGTSDFCVMKYEAKNVSSAPESNAAGSPWVSISQTTSVTECASLGGSYRLITNEEWMTIASNVANVDENWSGGTVGSGVMNRGHSDNSPSNSLAASTDDDDPCSGTGQTCDASTWHEQRRTHKLSNGEVIWDLSGNVRNWTSAYEVAGKICGGCTGWKEYSESLSDGANWSVIDLVPRNSQKGFWDDTWDSDQEIGRYVGNTNISGGALHRGGGWANASYAGVFTADMYDPEYRVYTNLGFRCSASVP
ncbi:MAG: hypothetical protein AB8C84_12855, partial [Oligoflexales bacterium]